MISRAWLLLGLYLPVMAGAAAQPAAADHRALEQVACRATHQVGLDAIAPALPGSPAQWLVRCRPHGQIAGDPWHHLLACRKTAAWDCRAAGQAVMMHINGRNVTASSESVDGPTIHAMLTAVGKSAIPLAEPGKRRGKLADCQLSGDASDPRVARMELNCDGWHLVFVRLCRPDKCEFNIASRLYLARPRS